MKYVMTFAMNTSGYRCHALGCLAAKDSRLTNLLPGEFASIDDARNYANTDESEKAGCDTRADFRVCKCAK
jgi:hypothetical protein